MSGLQQSFTRELGTVAMPPHRHVNRIPSLPACDWCRGCLVGLCLALAGCSSAPQLESPQNLSLAKAAIDRYLDSGAYAGEIESVVRQASAWLDQRCARRGQGERLAVVFDIDETVLSNAPLIRRLDYAYIPAEWARWVESCEAPAIAPVAELYARAKELGCEIHFVTGRRDPADRLATEENLRRRGMGEYASLLMTKPGEESLPAAQRKLDARKTIEARGARIIANIGDQESDLRGGHSERVFKLPNPFYLME